LIQQVRRQHCVEVVWKPLTKLGREPLVVKLTVVSNDDRHPLDGLINGVIDLLCYSLVPKSASRIGERNYPVSPGRSDAQTPYLPFVVQGVQSTGLDIERNGI